MVAVSQLYGLALVVLLLAAFPPDTYAVADFLWGAAAGVSGGVGLVALYAVWPGPAWAWLPGSRPEWEPLCLRFSVCSPAIDLRPVASFGVVLALAAIFIVGRTPRVSAGDTATSWMGSKGIPEALVAGVGFGAFFIFLSNTASTSGVWPLVGARVASLALLWVILAALPGTVSIRAETNSLILGAGSLDIIANALFLYVLAAAC